MRFIYSALAMFIFLTLSSTSQPLTKFLSDEGYNTALTEAQTALGDPELLALATVTGEYDTGQLKLDLEFDRQTGAASTWLYIFRSKTNPDSVKSWLVVKIIIAYMAMPFDMFDLSMFLPFFADEPLNIATSLNSKKMMENVRKNEDYIAIQSDTSMKARIAGQGVSVDDMIFEKGKPYWFITFANDFKRLNCYVHALSGETICMTFASVAALPQTDYEIEAYPNPTSGYITLKLPEAIAIEGVEMSLYNLGGGKVSLNGNYHFEGSVCLLDCKDLPAGMYFLHIKTNNKVYKTSFFVNFK